MFAVRKSSLGLRAGRCLIANNNRSLSNTAILSNDWARAAVHRLLEEQEHNQRQAQAFHGVSINNTVHDQQLDKAMHWIHNLMDEAQLCIADCKNCTQEMTNAEEEIQAADKAFSIAVTAIVDWLDELREVPDVPQRWTAAVRKDLTDKIIESRKELNQLKTVIIPVHEMVKYQQFELMKYDDAPSWDGGK